MTVTEPLRESVKAPRGYLLVGRTVAIPMRRASVLAGAGLLVLLLAAAVATLTWGRLGLDLADLPAGPSARSRPAAPPPPPSSRS
ncbi:hypothetical protein ABZ136_37995, partial [Streptomyces microflavus]